MSSSSAAASSSFAASDAGAVSGAGNANTSSIEDRSRYIKCRNSSSIDLNTSENGEKVTKNCRQNEPQKVYDNRTKENINIFDDRLKEKDDGEKKRRRSELSWKMKMMGRLCI